MAEKRMFAKTVIDSDAFLDMPLSTQALYFHLSMRADDDGFINNPKKIQRMIGCSDDDLKVLIAKAFIIPFESGIVVIKHWKIHNYIRKDTYRETVYQEEKAMLEVKDNKAYTLSVDGSSTARGRLVDDTLTQNRIDKNRIGQNSIDKYSQEQTDLPSGANGKRFVPPTVEEVRDYCMERGNTINAEQFYDFYQTKGWMVGKNKMKDWKACVRTWERNAKKNDKPVIDIWAC